MTRATRCWMAGVGAALLLTACGGGGGGGGDGPSGNFSVSDYQVTADAAAAAVLASGSMDEQLEHAFAPGSGAARPRLQTVSGVSAFALTRFPDGSAGLEQAKASTSVSETTPCDFSGSLTVRMTFEIPLVIPPGFVIGRQAGDKITVTASNCAFSEGDRPVDGRFIVTFLAYTDEDDYELSLAFDHFGTDILQLDGIVRVTSVGTSGSMTLAYRGLTATFDASTSTWHHTVHTQAGATVSASYSGTFEASDGSTYSWEQPEPFVLASGTGYPGSGVLRVTDAQGDSIDIVAQESAFRYDFFAAGSATPTASATGRAYAD